MKEEGRPPGSQPQQQHHTASECSGGGGERIPFLPRGELHPYTSCVWCGANKDLRPAILITFAEALACEDVAACERRRYRKRAAA